MRCLTAIGLTLFIVPIMAGIAISLWYFEENRRGAREWEATLQDIRNHGEPTDYEAMVPAPVPDDLNLAMLPVFRTVPDPQRVSSVLPVGLTEAVAKMEPGGDDFPKMPTSKGRRSDEKAIAAYLATHYRAAFPAAKEQPGPLTQFDAICPAINELRVASAVRPFCRFPRDYTTVPAYNRQLTTATSMVKLSKMTNLHAVVALRENRPEVALGDILAVLKIEDGLREEPILVSGLVAVGIYRIQESSIWEGLEAHSWNDAQLARLQQALQKIDFLTDNQLCLRGEVMGFLGGTLDYLRDHRDQSKLVWGMSGNSENNWTDNWTDTYMRCYVEIAGRLTPNGWYDLAKAKGISVSYQDAREAVDLGARQIHPEKPEKFIKVMRDVHPYDVPEIVLGVGMGPIFMSSCSFGQGQAHVDMAAIACGLERYRLAHGTFPSSLNALNPYFPEGLPHDPMSGEAYCYHLREDGTFLLYSIGWDLKDGGGKPAFLPDKPDMQDREHGDWVWPTAHTASPQ